MGWCCHHQQLGGLWLGVPPRVQDTNGQTLSIPPDIWPFESQYGRRPAQWGLTIKQMKNIRGLVPEKLRLVEDTLTIYILMLDSPCHKLHPQVITMFLRVVFHHLQMVGIYGMGDSPRDLLEGQPNWSCKFSMDSERQLAALSLSLWDWLCLKNVALW